jgi:cation-transporting P-type ATPase 13A2
MFTYRFINFEYHFSGEQFVPIQMNTAMKYDELRATYLQTKPEAERSVDRIKYGRCIVDVPEKTVLKLLTSEVLNPFYIFQIFAVALWIYDYYLVYASCIFIVSLIGVVVSIIENV